MIIANTLLAILMAATLAVLVTGVLGFLKGGPFNQRYGNRLMQARVGLQFACLVLVAIILFAHLT
ncbi:Hypoxia induced protein conserved region [Arboricoccus pini]|uniref:Hypoxia induced protein conserved region n=1 Tax=Arboricoccus pini TaxID=1963835 RepID=A0A212RDW0_9PROT|nr:twin transmembrane helix small protein [Arboricoccus pini]SNB70461.1 Hypoxia induced protein conserved region [Arboricoccus pini]